VTRLVLLPSPLLGATTWRPAAEALRGHGWPVTIAGLPEVFATPADVLAGFLNAIPDEPGLVLVPHSNAGLYAAAITAHREVAATVFVDAAVPVPGAAMAPPELVAHLETLVDADGLLPPWTQWWAESDLDALFPDAATRRRVETEQHRLPLAYFRSAPPGPGRWDVPTAYLAFGHTYAAEQAAAADRGWPVRILEGEHLHQLVDPEAVVAALEGLLDQLGVFAADVRTP
jgi:hypothetical protein